MMSKSEISRIVKEYSVMELICSGIQIAGGSSLAYCTYKNGTNEYLTLMLSGIAFAGTYNFCKTVRNNWACIFMDRTWSTWDFTTGALTYTAGLYAFSENLKRNDEMWVPYLALTASGYYLTTSAIAGLDAALFKRPLLKCCQLMFAPSLLGCSATYLFHFQHHSEGWLKSLLFLVTAVNGFNVGDRGASRHSAGYNRTLLKGIEMFIGGTIFCISSAALTFYSLKSEKYWLGGFFTGLGCIYGFLLAFDSLSRLQVLVDMETIQYECSCQMIGGTIIFLSACVGVKCVGNPRDPFVLPGFLFTAGVGLALLQQSLTVLYMEVPFPVFMRTCQRVLGPIVLMHSSLFAAYIGHHMGWRFSLGMLPFITVGTYAMYKGYRRSDEPRQAVDEPVA